MEYFVPQNSIVRTIWGSSDTIMFIFAGAAAEFALNKAVDWLYFTGRLPADPLGRLFSTVTYSRMIIFSEKEKAHAVIKNMANIHAAVEENRGRPIPGWAYCDVLFMLIDYSIRSYELLQRPLSLQEKEAVFHTFYEVGSIMGIQDLPQSFSEWLVVREVHLNNNLQYSVYSVDLFNQYKKHLGRFRYFLLREGQALIVPRQVHQLLQLKQYSWLTPILYVYKLGRRLRLDWLLKSLVLPAKYKAQVKEMDIAAR